MKKNGFREAKGIVQLPLKSLKTLLTRQLLIVMNDKEKLEGLKIYFLSGNFQMSNLQLSHMMD